MFDRFLKKEKKNQYIFLHVPKTAGTTFRAVLERNYKVNEICAVYPNNPEYYQPDQVKSFLERDKDRFACFLGHIPFGFHKWIGRDLPYITFLRNPVDRVISLYHHIMTHDPRFAEHKVSIVKFIQGYQNIQANNQQVRLLAGVDVKFGAVTEEMLWDAVENIEKHFSFVGLTEFFDESLVLLKDELGLHSPWYVRDNVSRNRPERSFFSAVEMDVIRKFNGLDMVLYSYVKRKLMGEITSEFQIAVERFREKNKKKRRIINPNTVWGE